MAFAPGNCHQTVLGQLKVNRFPEFRIGDRSASAIAIRAAFLPAIVLPDMPPAVAAFDDVDGIRPDGRRFACRLAIDPYCRVEDGGQFHRIIGGIFDAAEAGGDLHGIAISDKSPAPMPGAGFVATVNEEVEAMLAFRYSDCCCREVKLVGNARHFLRFLPSLRQRNLRLPARPEADIRTVPLRCVNH
ncbi:hypothetical protein FHX10_001184 [Rhizobium sp. BK591]|nr:hypothetical protein [Rhizobium sp. BK591]